MLKQDIPCILRVEFRIGIKIIMMIITHRNSVALDGLVQCTESLLVENLKWKLFIKSVKNAMHKTMLELHQ